MRKTVLALLLGWVCGLAYPQVDLQNYYAASRYDYYTNQQTGQIFVWIPESKKGMEIKVDIVLDFGFLSRGVPVYPGHAMPVSFELKRFKEGENEVTVSFYENEKWVDSRKVKVILLEKKPNEVRRDLLTGTLIADDLPFFPMGFYCQWPVYETLPEEEVVKGFNLISPYWKIERKGRNDRLRFMDKCAELGMKVNYHVCNVANGGMFTTAEGSLTKAEKLKLLEKEVIAVRDHPALLTYYLYDEPEGQGVPPDSLQEAYNLIKKLDPYHPVTIVFMAPMVAQKYSKVMDIAMTDPYPVPNGPITQVAEYMDFLDGFCKYKMPVWLVPQAFGGNEWWTREPDPRELRAMTYLGIIHNASGIQYFIRKGLNGSPKSQATWGECGAIAQEMMELLPSLASGLPEPPVVADRPEIQARCLFNYGLFTIIVVNTANTPLDFNLKVQDVDLSMDLDVLFEGRTLKMTEGGFADMIDAYGTRIYRFDNRMKADWQKDIERGNLTVDPGFENIASAAIPAACYATPGINRGSTYFLDGRVRMQGDHSIMLNTPDFEHGVKLNFYGLELDPDNSYTCSIWAKKADEIRPREYEEGEAEVEFMDPDMMFMEESEEKSEEAEKEAELEKNEKEREKEKKDKKSCGCDAMLFNLSLGIGNQKDFELTSYWTEYSFSTAGNPVQPSLARWAMPGLELVTAGVAWFDMLQVVPDMSMEHRAKGMVAGGHGGVEIGLKYRKEGALITYTIDGTQPTVNSTLYQDPFTLEKTATVKAAAFMDNQLVGTISRSYTVHKALGAKVNYVTSYQKYTAGGDQGLADGILGTNNYKDGKWQGFHGKDAIFVLDLGSEQDISTVRINFLQDISVWIFLPVKVKMSISEDGITYQPAATITQDVPQDRRGAFIYTFTASFDAKKARFIKIEAESIGNCPAWHSGAGQPGWIFLDEVIID